MLLFVRSVWFVLCLVELVVGGFIQLLVEFVGCGFWFVLLIMLLEFRLFVVSCYVFKFLVVGVCIWLTFV